MRRISLLLVMSACFACVALDNSKLVAALPTLARVAHASPTLERWIVEASLLVYASLLLMGGSLSERFGSRRMLLWGLAGFGATSLAGALTSSLYGLILARAATGACTACVTPATLATLKHSFDDAERPRAIAIWTASFGVGASLGPLLAGLLVTRGGVAAVLLANLPPIALCFWGSWRLVSADLPRRDVPLDWPGAALCLAAAGCLLFAILGGPTHGWLGAEIVGSALGGALCALGAVAWLKRARHPLFDLSLFAQRRFSRALLVILLGYFAFSGVSFVFAQYLQVARAKSAFESGLLSLPLAGSLLVGTLLAPAMMVRFGTERALLVSLGVALGGAALLACASYGSGDVLVCASLLPFGIGCGSTFANATELTLGSVPPERGGTAGALSESAFEYGGVLGVAGLSTVLGVASTDRQALLSCAPRAFWVGAFAVLCALLAAASLALRPSPVALNDARS